MLPEPDCYNFSKIVKIQNPQPAEGSYNGVEKPEARVGSLFEEEQQQKIGKEGAAPTEPG